MHYTIKAGILYNEAQTALAKIINTFLGPQRRIHSMAGDLLLTADVRYVERSDIRPGDVRNREYVLTGSGSQLLCSARPGYADGDDPDVVGWPISRMPRVDHAQVSVGETEYVLTMENSQNYSLIDTNDAEILHIMHKGIAGGWTVESSYDFAPEIISGIFTFCRYIEQENEFLIV